MSRPGVLGPLRLMLGAALLLALVGGLSVPAYAQAASPVINEFVFNHTGSDTNEYVEIFGAANTDYSSLTLLEIEGDGSGAGVIDGVLPVGTTDASGFWTTGFLADEFENGTVTLLLVEGFAGAVGNDLDTDNNGSLDVTPWTAVIDGVAVTDGGSGDQTYASVVLAGGFDGVTFTPGGASRIPNGTDTDTIADWVRNDFDLAGIPGFTGTLEAGEAANTPSAPNSTEPPPPPQPEVCGELFTPIYTIQGSNDASGLVANVVSTEGIVVGDFQPGDGDDFGSDLGGFYIQDAAGDGNVSTSDGIFVYAPGAEDVVIGDSVRVRGMVTEHFGLTEIKNVQLLLKCGTGSITPTDVSLADDADNFEQYEGMLVTFPEDLTISEYFNFDRFGEIVLTRARQFQPTAIYEPGSPDAADLATENSLFRITLDDGRSSQNPDPARHPNGSEFTLDNRFRGGDILQDVTGVMDYSFGLYRIQPTTGATYVSSNPRTDRPDATGGRLQVASFNVLNYFLTLDDGTPKCGPGELPADKVECRGADNAEEFDRQRAKILSALSAINADVFGLIEMENTPGVEPLSDLVDGLNATLGAGTYAYVDTGVIGTDAIRVGIIYKTSTVAPVGGYAILDSSVDPRFDDGKNRPALAQTFEEFGTGERFTVVVNHLKSKGSECGPGDDDPQQGNCNGTRTQAAEAMVDWLKEDPTGSDDPDILIIGDLNAYDKEDPIDAIRAGADDTLGTDDDYVDLLLQYQGEEAYSYVFDGQLGYLDHALAIQSLAAQITGATAWHINADEPDILDYDTSFKQDAQDALYAPDAYRSSDHDPVIVGLALYPTIPPLATLTFDKWNVDRVQGLDQITLFDKIFFDNQGRTGTWYPFKDGRRLLLTYPSGVACGAVVEVKVTPNLKMHGSFECQDDPSVWGFFHGTTDTMPPFATATGSEEPSLEISSLDIPSLCDPRNAESRAWALEQGVEVDPCYTLSLPLLRR